MTPLILGRMSVWFGENDCWGDLLAILLFFVEKQYKSQKLNNVLPSIRAYSTVRHSGSLSLPPTPHACPSSKEIIWHLASLLIHAVIHNGPYHPAQKQGRRGLFISTVAYKQETRLILIFHVFVLSSPSVYRFHYLGLDDEAGRRLDSLYIYHRGIALSLQVSIFFSECLSTPIILSNKL